MILCMFITWISSTSRWAFLFLRYITFTLVNTNVNKVRVRISNMV